MNGKAETLVDFPTLLSQSDEELAAAWRAHIGGKPPPGLPKSLLVRLLAYRIQALRQGDLTPATRRLLHRIAQDRNAGNRKPASIASDVFHLKAGTVLVREYGGIEHRVMVLADGIAWNGEVYKSLSAVATAITGTRWNGHRFFGLEARRGGRTGAADGFEGRTRQPERSRIPEPSDCPCLVSGLSS